ncbi:MAG: hypothetical protein KJ619_02775 [Candidatus Omnitrophica bacterium]|nr:hypothetical protein [Candidatus Omnitrophota bacterium]
MKTNKPLTIAALILIYLMTASSTSAKNLLPKRLMTETKEFYENQITPEDKAFLDQLQATLIALSEINQGTLDLFNSSFPAGTKHYRRVTRNIRGAARKINSKLLGVNKPIARLEEFVKTYLGENSEVLQTLRSLTLDYLISEEITKYIDSGSKSTVYAEGAYHYYNLCAESFENGYGANFQELFKDSADNYSRLSELARLHQIKKLNSAFIASSGQVETAISLIGNRIVNKIELSNRSWAKQAITNALDILQKQLLLNRQLNMALLEKFKEIPLPHQARLPDLTVSSIEIVLPPKIKKGTIIKVIAEIKNEGDLAADRSRVLMIFPEGFKKARPVPKLLPQESVKVVWRYKVRRKGDHDFNAVVNYDRRAWEANTDNNTTCRTLLIPRCSPL